MLIERTALGWVGIVTVIRRTPQGTYVERMRNLITDAGLDFLRDRLKDSTKAGITHVAIGSDSTTPANGDTALGSEFFRKQTTSTSDVATGRLLTTLFVSTSEANTSEQAHQWEEIGWFADASSATDSGVLIARRLHQLDKSELETVQIDRDDILQRA